MEVPILKNLNLCFEDKRKSFGFAMDRHQG